MELSRMDCEKAWSCGTGQGISGAPSFNNRWSSAFRAAMVLEGPEAAGLGAAPPSASDALSNIWHLSQLRISATGPLYISSGIGTSSTVSNASSRSVGHNFLMALFRNDYVLSGAGKMPDFGCVWWGELEREREGKRENFVFQPFLVGEWKMTIFR